MVQNLLRNYPEKFIKNCPKISFDNLYFYCYLNRSDADFIILGGDFNADPKANANETTLADINRIMKNSIEEYFHRIEVRMRKIKILSNFIISYRIG